MSKVLFALVALVAMVGMASATIVSQGVPTQATGYTDYSYFVQFASGAEMALSWQGYGGSCFSYNNLPLTDEQYQADFAEGVAAYESYLHPPVVEVPVVEPVVEPTVEPVVEPTVEPVVEVPVEEPVVAPKPVETVSRLPADTFVLPPSQSRSVACTVGMGSVNSTFDINAEAAEHLGH